MKKHIPTIIFYGALWGIIEATLGHIIHILPVSIYISGTVLFPIVSYILYKAYKQTNSRSALLAVGVIAAAIKAVDFFMPFGSPFKIVNPMIAIIMESLMVVAVITVINKDDLKSKATSLVIASVGWRLLFVLYNLGQYVATGFVGSYIATWSSFIQFTLLYGLISAALGVGVLYLDKFLLKDNKLLINKFNPVISLATLAVAVILTILL